MARHPAGCECAACMTRYKRISLSRSKEGQVKLPTTPGGWKTILADPPWPEYGGILKSAKRHYPLMTFAQIEALPVKDVVGENAHLYLWVSRGFIPQALNVIKAWGFRWITHLVWVKTTKDGQGLRMGIGQYFRTCHETCFFAVRGRLPYRVQENGKRAQGKTVIKAPPGKHSEKPKAFRDMVEQVSYAPRLELFARARTLGWMSWGNEV